MKSEIYQEYLELLKGVKEELSSKELKNSYILSEKDNWEALRLLMTAAPQIKKPPTPQKTERVAQPPSPQIVNQTYQVKTETSVPRPVATISKPLQNPPSTPLSTEQNNTTHDHSPVKSAEKSAPLSEKTDRSLSIMELTPPPEIDFQSWKSIFSEKFPQISLLNPPSPTENTARTQTVISILYEKATPQELKFLQNIARTCHLLLGPCRLITLEAYQNEQTKNPAGQSKNAEILLGYSLQFQNSLQIDSFEMYVKNPALKGQLWRQLTHRYYSHE